MRPAANFTAPSITLSPEPASYPQISQTRQTMLNRLLALTRQIHREYPISQIELWQQPGLVAGIALTLSAFPLERRLPPSLRGGLWVGGVLGSFFLSFRPAGYPPYDFLPLLPPPPPILCVSPTHRA